MWTHQLAWWVTVQLQTACKICNSTNSCSSSELEHELALLQICDSLVRLNDQFA
jgi:positive regulator of sigma E activity